MPTLFCGLKIDSVVNFPVDNYWFCRLTDLSGNVVSGGGLLTHLWRACDPPPCGGLVSGGLVSRRACGRRACVLHSSTTYDAGPIADPWMSMKWFLMLKFVHRILCDVNVHWKSQPASCKCNPVCPIEPFLPTTCSAGPCRRLYCSLLQ